MFNSSQRNFAQKATTTTDNTPSTTISVKVGVKDTYITNKTSDYASKVFEPKGSKFITVADVDFTPTEPGTYTLPLTDEEISQRISRISGLTAAVYTQSLPSLSKTLTIEPSTTVDISQYEFGGTGSDEENFTTALKRAFDNSTNRGGYVVIDNVTRNGLNYVLVLESDGNLAPIQTAYSSLPPELSVMDDVLVPDVLNRGFSGANTDCCQEKLQEWQQTPDPVRLGRGGGYWSPSNPCGYLGSVFSCESSVSYEYETVSGSTSGGDFEGGGVDPVRRGFDPTGDYYEDGNNPPPGWFDPEFPNPCQGRFSETVGGGIRRTRRVICFTRSIPSPFPPILGQPRRPIRNTVCVIVETRCEWTTTDYYGAGCGCPFGCPCDSPECIGHPNCQGITDGNVTTTSSTPNSSITQTISEQA